MVVIGNDAAWTQIRRGQDDLIGVDRAVATGLDRTRYVGVHAAHVETPAQIRPALERALAADRAAVINARIGPSDFRSGAISI